MNFSKGCTEGNDYTVIEETDRYYLCKCNKCGEQFKIWK